MDTYRCSAVQYEKSLTVIKFFWVGNHFVALYLCLTGYLINHHKNGQYYLNDLQNFNQPKKDSSLFSTAVLGTVCLDTEKEQRYSNGIRSCLKHFCEC